MTARTPDGSRPTREALSQAQQIISARVNGLGVSGSEVIVDGDNLVITVPGKDSNEARNLGQTARLYIRPVINALPADSAPLPGRPQRLPAPHGTTEAAAWSDTPADPYLADSPVYPRPASPVHPHPARTWLPGGAAACRQATCRSPGRAGRPPQPQAVSAGAPSPAPTPPSPAPATARRSGAAGSPAPAPVQPGPPDPRKDLAERIAKQREWRQSTNKGVQFLALQYEATQCNQEDILAGNDDPDLPLVTCDTDHKEAYLLAPSIISGDQIENASSGMDQHSGGYVVDLQFKSGAANTWADFTAAHIGTQTAFTLDSQVVSAPQIREAIPGGRTQITGGDPPFTASTARQLANVLKYGSLPLSFESSEAQTVSATLGLTSLRAGLIAGAIGLVLVLLYSLLYYRALGLLTALSLGSFRRNGFRDPGTARPIYQLHPGPGRYRRSDHRYRDDGRLVRGVLRTHQRRDPRRPFVPVGGSPRLGASPQDDLVG